MQGIQFSRVIVHLTALLAACTTAVPIPTRIPVHTPTQTLTPTQAPAPRYAGWVVTAYPSDSQVQMEATLRLACFISPALLPRHCPWPGLAHV